METSNPDVRDLRAFCLVADLGSITKAARLLGEAKGTVSRRLTRLEDVVGATLLRRNPRLVQATEDGAAYRARVGRVLELLDDANAEVQHEHAVPSGHLRITAPFDLAVSVFAPLAARFTERFPAISVEFVLTQALLDFDANQIDVALRATSALQDSSLVAHKLEDMRGHLYAAPSYLAAHGTPRKPAELASHQLLVVRATRGAAPLSLRHLVDGTSLRIRARAAISASDYAFCREAAVAGGGIALLPKVVAQRDLDAGRLVPVLSAYALFDATLYLVHSGARLLPPKVRAFRDFMIDAFAARPGARSARPARRRSRRP